ncbi:plasminogen activator inhibitor 1-like isoform X2 [Pectinophora gossypiella]|nr:plasminogen activator inhibitor 1-like isoform X2 [Pectinophora gossypiella]XP_049868516.1 plasminogen activator inhibitor 1-like isoform X2 [Pectinophora gossypiella]XP_049868517.1 plasminogen activator inhibitor 1-like isoform X2 [Pectinophora gossypiella]
MAIKIASIIFVTVLYITSSVQNETTEVPSAMAATQERDVLSRSINEFGYQLMMKMMKQNVNNNVVMSPTGVAGLLAMTLLGTAGTSYDELAKALGFSQDILSNRKNHEIFGNLLKELNSDDENLPNSEATHTVSNEVTPSVSSTEVPTNDSIPSNIEFPSRTLYADAIVVDDNTRIRKIYRDYLERVYDGDALTTQFADTVKSQQLINDWVKTHTQGKIEDFLKEPLPVATKVVLLSALYFSGQWAFPFIPELTRKMEFHTPNGGNVTADLMLNQGQFNYTFSKQHQAQMLAFPYHDRSTTMYVLKPLLRTRVSLTEILDSLDYSKIEAIMDSMTEQRCIIRFPKMELKTRANLKDALKELGVKSVFSPSEANFALMVDNNTVIEKKKEVELVSRIYTGDEELDVIKEAINKLPNPGVHVDTVLHEVKMTVNEYGTMAVAVTSGTLARTAQMFYADSPFYMFIRNEKTKLVTFSAIIFDPTQ